jgi:predicted dienelactone hydrolase
MTSSHDAPLAVGLQRGLAHDAEGGVEVPIAWLYPTRAPARETAFGPYTLEVAERAEVLDRPLRACILSHGNGSSPWVHRALASALAKAGHVVAMVEHPGNRRGDNALAGTYENLLRRPRHLRLAIDATLGAERIGAHLTDERVSVIGHSVGGYTALAVAGGAAVSFERESPEGERRALPVLRDARVSKLVLLTPATPWFFPPGSLRAVEVPILMVTGSLDEETPEVHAQAVLAMVPYPERVTHRRVEGAGHFSVLTPFPPALCRPEFPPSQDPPGFDRAAFQSQLHQWVIAFLDEAEGAAL